MLDAVAKRLTGAHESRYRPATSIAARFRARIEGGALGTDSGGAGDDDMDDSDDDDFLDDEDEPGERAERVGWQLRDISLVLRSGEALAIIGDRDSVDLLTRVVGRMTQPTAGRILFRGRLGFTFGLATAMMRDEHTSPPRALRAVASLAGVPRSERRRWIDDALTLVGGDLGPAAWRFDEKETRRRLALAVSLDPTATVLLVDKLPDNADAAFRERCLGRLRARLLAGAAALIACADLDAIEELCTSVAWLEQGSIATTGPPSELLEQYRTSMRTHERAAYAATPSFNATIAIHRVEASAGQSRGIATVRRSQPFRVSAELETAKPNVLLSCRVRLVGPTRTVLAQEQPVRLASPGRHVATLEADARSLKEGEYSVSVEVAAFEKDGRRSVVMRPLAHPLRVLADGDPEANVPTGELADDLPMLDWSIVSELDVERA